jgi:regulator of protease activity HflC (stomatin/prohibitin superfamily)
MKERITAIWQAVREAIARIINHRQQVGGVVANGTARTLNGVRAIKGSLIVLGIVGATVYFVYSNPPLQSIGRGDLGVRTNLFTGELTEWREGTVVMLPGLHQMRVFSVRDQTYRPEKSVRADGPAPLQSLEGLSLGVDLTVRYALDPTKLRDLSAKLPDDISGEIVEPAVQGVIYKVFAKHTVREIFSTRRMEIQRAIETELNEKLTPDGIKLRSVLVGKVDLPADYPRGMDGLLADKVQVIIAPPSSDSGFIGASLIGGSKK